MQNDFCPGGALAVAEGDAVVPLVNRIAPAFRGPGLHPGLAPAGPHVLRRQPSRAPRPSRSVEMPYGAAGALAGALRAGHAGRRVPPRPRRPTRADLVLRKGFRPRDRQLLGLLRERPHHADRASPATCASAGCGEVWLAGLATDFCVAWSAIDAAAARLRGDAARGRLPGDRPRRLADAGAAADARGRGRPRPRGAS